MDFKCTCISACFAECEKAGQERLNACDDAEIEQLQQHYRHVRQTKPDRKQVHRLTAEKIYRRYCRENGYALKSQL